VLHPADGTLRRFHDEPQAFGDAVRQHVDACPACRDRLAGIGAAARAAETALGPDEATAIDPRAALAVVRARTLGETSRPAARPAPPWADRRYAAPLGGLAAAAAVLLLVAFTPLGTVAQNFLAIFEPRQFVAIPVTRADLEQLRALPDLEAYGLMREGPRPAQAVVATPQAAAFLAGMPVRFPRWLPASLPRVSGYHVMARTTCIFTFSAAKALRAAASTGKPLPPMPPRLDGSSLTATIGPVVLATYGAHFDPRSLRGHGARTGRASRDVAERMLSGPVLVVAQAPVPRVSSTGAGVREIESYLLKQPGVPPQLAAEIAAIGDPATTLPVPIPIERDIAERVVVQGVPGLGILDNTGMGSGVIWQRGGMIYAVAGTLPARDLLSVANSLR
jgi:hypothetical protein